MKTELIKSVGLQLADIRRDKELSIFEVSKNTSINKDTISKYENGNSSMKIFIPGILLDFYDVDVASFFKKVYDRLQLKEQKE